MKKLFLAILVAATMVACAKNEVVKQAQGDAITFADAFVDNSVRAAVDGSYTTNTLDTFTVYGTVTNAASQSANIFEDVVVTKGGTGTGSSWTYGVEHTQYWIAGNTYNFAAVVNGTTNASAVNKNSLGMPVNVVCTNASAQNDILYAESAPIAYQKGDNTEVKFTFSHLMSKVKFTAKNVMTTDNGYTYQVKDVRINNATLSGTYTFATEAWTDQAGAYAAEFGNVMVADNSAVADMKMGDKFESNYERLLIPGAQTLNVTADIELYRNGVLIETKADHAMDVAVTLAAGKAYNFVVSLGNPGEPITFALEKVTDWVEETVYPGVTVVDENNIELYNEEGLFWFANQVNSGADTFAGKTVTLTSDVTMTKAWTPIGVERASSSFRGTFDGGNHTISNLKVNAVEAAGFFGKNWKGNISNLYFDNATIVGTHFAGVVVGWADGAQNGAGETRWAVTNCHVTNSTVTLSVVNNDNGDKAGALVGYAYAIDVLNCSVADTTIKGYRDLGGIVGILNSIDSKSAKVDGCTVGANVKIVVDNSVHYKNYTESTQYNVANYAGRVNGPASTVGANTGNVTIEW